MFFHFGAFSILVLLSKFCCLLLEYLFFGSPTTYKTEQREANKDLWSFSHNLHVTCMIAGKE